MRLSRKLWVGMVVAVCLVVVQFNVTTPWLLAARPGEVSVDAEDVVRLAVERLQLDDRPLRELLLQLGRELLAAGGCPLPTQAAPATTTTTTTTKPARVKLPVIYVITPTYRRPEQIADLTRLAQTLMHVPDIYWLVIEDAQIKTRMVTELLERSGMPFEHLIAPMPEEYKKKKGPKPRGVSNRNRGLEWLRANATSGVFYFADDDNSYDIQLFEEIRTTKRVSMWPVGLCTKYGLSSPVIKNGSFSGFYDGWIGGRKFPVDMASFAVSVEFLLQRPKAAMPYKPGFEEDGFLKSLAPFEPKEIELKANKCTRILVWHTQTKKNEPSAALDMTKYDNTNLVILKQQIV